MSKASETLQNVILFIPECYRNIGPFKTKLGVGQYTARLPEETREILKTLESDDIKNLRLDYCASVVSYYSH